jgi:hypothetical protein
MMAPPTAPPAGPLWAIAPVDIASADAKSAPVISARFKLASCFLSTEAELPKKKMVPAYCLFFPT